MAVCSFIGITYIGLDSPFHQQVAHALIVLNMLDGDGHFAKQIILPQVVVGNFRGQVLCGDGNGREEVCQWAFFRNTKPVFHDLGSVPTEKSGVTLGADPAKSLIIHSSFIDILGKLNFGIAQFLAGLQAFLQSDALLDNFLPPGLNGEIALGKGNRILAGVTVLSNEVTSVAGQHNILNRPFRAGSDPDHFVDVNKMVHDRNTSIRTGILALVHDLEEVAPFRIA